MKYAYKIFEEKDCLPHTLFHGLNGSRKLKVGTWLRAECKRVTTSTLFFESGFHAYPSKEHIVNWLTKAKNNDTRVVVKVAIEDVALKPGSLTVTYLAQRMRISKQAWAGRMSAQDFLQLATEKQTCQQSDARLVAEAQ